MKRNFLFKNHMIKYLFEWFISFLISISIMFILIFLLAFLMMQISIIENILLILMFVLYTVSAGICSYIFQRLSKSKGYVSGMVTATMFCLIKLIMSLAYQGIGKGNFMIYISLIAMALIGGIVSANRKNKKNIPLVNINKLNKI